MKHHFLLFILLTGIVGLGTWQVSSHKQSVLDSKNNLAAVSASNTDVPPNCKTNKLVADLSMEVSKIQKEVTAYDTTLKNATTSAASLRKNVAALEIALQKASTTQQVNRAKYEKQIADGDAYVLKTQAQIDSMATSTAKTKAQGALKTYIAGLDKTKAAWKEIQSAYNKTLSARDVAVVNLNKQILVYNTLSAQGKGALQEKLQKAQQNLDMFKAFPACPTKEALTQCSDKVDNDRDGMTDCKDADCAGVKACKTSVVSTITGLFTAGGKSPATTQQNTPTTSSGGGSGDRSGICCGCAYGPTNLEDGRAVDFSRKCDQSFAENKCTKTAKWYVGESIDADDFETLDAFATQICPAEKYENIFLFKHMHGVTRGGTGEDCALPALSLLDTYNWKRKENLNLTIESSQCYSFDDMGSAKQVFDNLPQKLVTEGWNQVHITLIGNQDVGFYDGETGGTDDVCKNLEWSKTRYKVCVDSAKGKYPPCPLVGTKCNLNDTGNNPRLWCSDKKGALIEMVCQGDNALPTNTDGEWMPVWNPNPGTADIPYNISQ